MLVINTFDFLLGPSERKVRAGSLYSLVCTAGRDTFVFYRDVWPEKQKKISLMFFKVSERLYVTVFSNISEREGF